MARAEKVDKIEKVTVVAKSNTGQVHQTYRAEAVIESSGVREAVSEGVRWLLANNSRIGGTVTVSVEKPVLEVTVPPFKDEK